MLTRRECRVLSIKTFVHFKYNIDIDLVFYVRVRACIKRVTGKQPLDSRGKQPCKHVLPSLQISLMFNCKPSSKPYNSSRANYLFTMLLLLSYLICLVAIGYSITRYRGRIHRVELNITGAIFAFSIFCRRRILHVQLTNVDSVLKHCHMVQFFLQLATQFYS